MTLGKKIWKKNKNVVTLGKKSVLGKGDSPTTLKKSGKKRVLESAFNPY